MPVTLRPAEADDFAAMTAVWLRAERLEPDPNQTIPTIFDHLSATGMLVVAEREGRVIGFASSFERSGVRFLGQMFIDPHEQSSGVGQLLLNVTMPPDSGEMATIASPDRRATGLYVRQGMFPMWPLYGLTGSFSTLRLDSAPDVQAVAAVPDDQELAELDAVVGGRRRPEDLRYLVEQRGGIPFWLTRGSERVGYFLLQVMRNSRDQLDNDETVRLGPLGVLDASDTGAGVLAALHVARELGTQLHVLVPGPGDATMLLLRAGCKIAYQDTFMSSTRPPFVDSLRYLPGSGGMY